MTNPTIDDRFGIPACGSSCTPPPGVTVRSACGALRAPARGSAAARRGRVRDATGTTEPPCTGQSGFVERARDRAVLPTIDDLDELAALLERTGRQANLYVRWSRGPDVDLAAADGEEQASRDSLTGVTLPGLSANPLRVEPWWGDRSTRLWIARRLYDYSHLRHLRGADVRPWVLLGEQCGRGPDNEPLVICDRAIAWVSEEALRQSEQAVREQGSNEWGPLHRAD
jgi:hypothetical protein